MLHTTHPLWTGVVGGMVGLKTGKRPTWTHAELSFNPYDFGQEPAQDFNPFALLRER